MHPLVKDICEKLLVRDPSKRLGAGIKGNIEVVRIFELRGLGGLLKYFKNQST